MLNTPKDELPFKITAENLKYWQALSNLRNDLRKVDRKLDRLQYSIESIRSNVYRDINEMVQAMQIKVAGENVMIAEIEQLKKDVTLLKSKQNK